MTEGPAVTATRAGLARRSAGSLGAAIILLALGLDLTTGARFSFGRAQLLLLLVGLAVLTVSIAGRRTPALYKGTALLLLNTLVALAAAELASFLVLQLATRGERPKQPLMSKSSYYASVPWGARYWADFGRANRERYEPYVMWRRQAYAGSLIAIGQDGVRATPGARCEEGAFNVFVFGGSVVWGVGSPDSLTIPAFMQRDLAQRLTSAVCVRNLGELGWVTTQEVIALMRELQAGRIPQVVVFLDGANDPYAAYQFGRSDVHFEYEKIRAKVEGRDAAFSAAVWARASNLYKLAARFGARRVDTTDAGHSARGGIRDIADETMRVHRANRTIVAALARQYGFTAHFFWQPSISAANKRLTAEESTIASAMSPEYRALYGRTHELAKRAAGAGAAFHYLGDVFDTLATTVYIDPVHVTPDGNAILARRIVAVCCAYPATGSVR
jgi:hypothetical protein